MEVDALWVKPGQHVAVMPEKVSPTTQALLLVVWLEPDQIARLSAQAASVPSPFEAWVSHWVMKTLTAILTLPPAKLRAIINEPTVPPAPPEDSSPAAGGTRP